MTEFCSIPREEVEKMREEFLRVILILKALLETLDTYSRSSH